jgi:hypothetical protein
VLVVVACIRTGTSQPEVDPIVAGKTGSESPRPRGRVRAAPAPPPLEGHALLRSGAALHSSPDGPRLATLTGPELGPVVPVRIVADVGGWLEVELLPAPHGLDLLAPPRGDTHCFPTITAGTVYRLRFFVPRDALARVVARPVEVAHPDGTGMRIEPGAWVHDSESAVATTDLEIALPLPRDAVGFAYAPALADRHGAGIVIGHDTELAIGEDTRVAVSSLAAKRMVEEIRRESDRILVEVRPRCVVLRGWIPSQRFEPDRGAGVIRLPQPREGWKAKLGATIQWPDGTEAGVVVGSTVLGPEHRPSGTRRCFAVGLVDAQRSVREATAELCLEPDAVYQAKRGTKPDASVPLLASTCPEGATCSSLCDDWEGCAYDCREAESCDHACAPDTRCTMACGAGKCVLDDCKAGAECSLSCPAGKKAHRRGDRWTCR